jgi:hypothetical protein
MDDQMAKMAEQGIPSVKLTDPNFGAVIDKFIYFLIITIVFAT